MNIVLYSGIAWTSSGYEVEVLEADGTPARPSVHFGAGEVGELTRYLHGIASTPGQALASVVDSTNGMLDGGLMVAGLEVYRADPWQLPQRPVFGSVTARELAEAARRNLPALARLRIDGGSLTERLAETAAGIAGSADAEAALVRAGRCLSHGERTDARIALTFDDGPNPPYTGQILDVLERYAVPATFFCVGLHASAHTSVVGRIAEEGHAIGNHTWSHPFLPDLSQPQLGAQLDRTNEVLAHAGAAVTALFRPPYGSRTPDVLSWLEKRDDTIVLWDVEPFDWALPGVDVITARVLEQARPGSIVLMHDGGGDRAQTVAALPAIIEGLLGQGYRFVLVDQLLG